MKNFIFGILILGFITSCSKFPGPSIELVSGYLFYKNGSEQRAMAGEFLKDSILLQVNGQVNMPAGMRVEFSILTGGGELTKPVTILDQSGIAYTNWKLGFESNQQIVKASVYDINGIFLSSTYFIEYAFRPNAWDTVKAYPDANMWDLVADTINNLTFMVSGGQLYKQSGKYYEWEAVNSNQFGGLSSVEIDSHSYLYVNNPGGDVYLSKDKGYSWNKCNRPFPNDFSYTFMFVSNNDWVWVSTADHMLAYSKDEGNTWTDASSGLSEGDRLGEIYRHPDGTLFFRTMNYRLYKSENEGKSWSPIISQDNVYELLMTSAGELLIYSFNGVHRIMKSTDKGEHFEDIYMTTSNLWTSNVFHYFKGTYYLLIAGKGIIRTKDLINFEEYLDINDLNDLFIDHNGVFIGKGLNSVYYRHNL